MTIKIWGELDAIGLKMSKYKLNNKSTEAAASYKDIEIIYLSRYDGIEHLKSLVRFSKYKVI